MRFPGFAVTEPETPFSYLYEALLGALGGQPNLLPWETVLGGFGFLVGAIGLTGRFGRRVLESD